MNSLLTISSQYLIIEGVDIFLYVSNRSRRSFGTSYLIETTRSKILSSFSTDIGMPMMSAFGFFVQIKDRFHHLVLFFHWNAGIFLMESVLLEESQSNNSCDLSVSFWSSGSTSLPISLTISIRSSPEFRIAISWFRYLQILGKHDLCTTATDPAGIHCSWSASGSPGNVARKPVICPVPRSSGRNVWCSW